MQTQRQNGINEFIRQFWLDTNDLPKHEKFRQAVTTSIVEGYWSPGERLPTEQEWVAAMPCGLGTVQRALRALVVDGVIERRRGSGTTVADLGRRIEEPWHMRFINPKDETQDYLAIYAKVLTRRVINGSGPWSEVLNQGKHPVVKIERIMAINDEFDVYNIFYALADRFPELVDRPMADLDGINLKILMAQKHRTPVHRVRQLMAFKNPPKRVLSKCRWPADAHAAALNVAAYSPEGEAMYYQDYYIPPNKYKLDLGSPTGL